MGFFESFQDVFSLAGHKAKKTYDAKKLALKIKGHEKEIRECYMEIGQALHESRKNGKQPDETKLDTIFDNIDNLTFRIAQLQKQLNAVRREEKNTIFLKKENKELNDEGIDTHTAKYALNPKLSQKADDLKMRRTTDGIKLVRICPDCMVANSPSADVCINCGKILRANQASS